MVLDLLYQLIATRSEDSWLKSFAANKDIPIWYISSQDLVKISDEYLRKDEQTAVKVYKMLK